MVITEFDTAQAALPSVPAEGAVQRPAAAPRRGAGGRVAGPVPTGRREPCARRCAGRTASLWVAGHVRQAVATRVRNAPDVPEGRADGRVALACRAGGGRAVAEVRDDGPGVAVMRPRIFGAVFTTGPVGEGTGSRLAIGRRLAGEHGGTLRSGPGPGGGWRPEQPPLRPA